MERDCGDSDLADLIDEATMFQTKLKKLRRRCKKRSITLNCDSIKFMSNLLECAEDALAYMAGEEEGDLYAESDEEFSWEDVHAFHQ